VGDHLAALAAGALGVLSPLFDYIRGKYGQA